MSVLDHDTRLMDLAVSEGRNGRPSPNPPVGAIVAQHDQVIASGCHERVGEEHAEVMALRLAGAAAQGATLYVSLEPCNHSGRTPPCVDAILKAGIRRVVIGREDPNPHVLGQGMERLRARGVEVVLLPNHRGAIDLTTPWSKFITTGIPYVRLKLGLSLDGRIATRSGASRWVTGEESRAKVHNLRSTNDAVAVGIGTAIADDPSLTVRYVTGPSPVRVVFDTNLRFSPSSHLATTAKDTPTIVLTSTSASKEAADTLTQLGVLVLQVETSAEGRLDVTAALQALAAQAIVTLVVEGGAELAGSLLATRSADELHAFIAPILLGPRGRPGAVDWAGPDVPADAPRIHLPHWELCGTDAYVWGPLEYPSAR